MSYFPEVVMLVKLPQDVCSLFFFFLFPNVTLSRMWDRAEEIKLEQLSCVPQGRPHPSPPT